MLFSIQYLDETKKFLSSNTTSPEVLRNLILSAFHLNECVAALVDASDRDEILIPLIDPALLEDGKCYCLKILKSETVVNSAGPNGYEAGDEILPIRRRHKPSKQRPPPIATKKTPKKVPESPYWNAMKASKSKEADPPASNATENENPKLYKCQFTWQAKNSNEISIEEGDIVECRKDYGNGWYWGRIQNGTNYGLIPSSYLCDVNEVDWQDDEYFEQYSALKIHREMLGDEPRTLAYKSAVEGLDKGLIVMDVGCGSGILSLICAKSGASMIYAIEGSEILAEQARKVVLSNGYNDVVHVYEGKIEDTDIPEQVDVIVSEWMGTLLIFESMIESVIVARDKYLKKGGQMLPHSASLYLCPVSVPELWEKEVGFWNELYGFDFSCFKELAASQASERPRFDHVISRDGVLSDSIEILSMDMTTVSPVDFEEINLPFVFTANRDGAMHGLGTWFEVGFPGLKLSTSPFDPPTHWKQDVFLFENPVDIVKGDCLSGRFHMTRNKEYRRHLHIHITMALVGHDYKVDREYRIWR